MSLAICSTAAVDAAVIFDYVSVGSNSNATISATNVDASVTADVLATGGGLNPNSTTTYNWRGWDIASTSYEAAVAAGDSFTWGFDVTAQWTTVTLTTMDIRLDRSSTGPDDVEIKASVNGATAVSLLTHDYNGSDSGVNFTGINLSSLGTLNTGDSVVLTLAAYNSETAAGTYDVENNEGAGIVMNADIASLPEPSSITLLALGGLATLLCRRR